MRCDRNLDGGVVALFVRKELKAKPIVSDKFIGIEFVAASAKFNGKEIIFCCFYRPNVQCSEVLPVLKLALAEILRKGKPLVLMGDFNLPGLCWEGLKAVHAYDQDKFLDMFTEFGLFQMVYESTRGDNILDLIFGSEPDLVGNVKIGPPLSSSYDHNTVVFYLNVSVQQSHKALSRRRLWEK